MIIEPVTALYTCSNIQHRSSYYTNYCTRSSYYTMMELNTYCTEIKYFYLELLAFYFILIGLSGELFWDEGISKHVFHSKQVTNKIGSNVHLLCTLTCQHIVNLRQQFYKLDVKTPERIKELGLKRKFRGCRGGKNKATAWSSNEGVHQHLLWTLPKCNITKLNHIPY